ncbi:MAG: PKD domain-containing protein, partial [Phaeodactylibacter sp.]|nr:PKD domain-containing protein [Phaeodactylibacter sp.]
MLTSGASTLLEPALTGLSHSGAANLLTDCRLWQSQALGASSGSAVFDTCSLGTVSITEQQPLSSYVTDDYFLVFADMCGDGEIITQINAAPANGGWAGLEVREDMASSARKFGLRTQTSTIVQPFIRSTAGQAITLLSFIKPPHQWLKVSRSGDYFTAYTSSDGNFWFFVYAAVLPLPECVKAGVYTQSLYVGAPATALFNQVTITDNSPATAVNFADSTLTAGSDTTLAHCGDEARLGGRFCMLSDVEITYTWDAEGQVIGEYTVVNDSIAIITGNIDTSTHELVITPGTTAEYVLRRTISDFGGLPNDFALCAETDTVTVTVLQAPPSPGFTFVVNEDSCQVQFTSLDTTGTHLWDFGDTGSSSAANPLHTYSGSGPFSVVHTISNECGAFDTTQVVNINCCTAPTLTITATHDGCGNVNFSATATGDNPTLVSYDWAFGDDATDTAAAPSHTYAGEGTYIASLTTVNDCGEQASATDTLTIDFPETPDATFTISIDTCSGRVDFTAAPGQEANGHLWAFGDAGNHTDQGVGLTAVSFTYPTPGTYTVSHTVDEPTCGASDLATATFTIPALPPVGDPSQVFTTHLGCNEVEFQLRDSLGGTLFFGDGASVIADTAYIYHTYSEAADYTATYTLGSGCAQDSFSFIVKLAQYAPQAEAQLTDTFCLGVVVSSADTIAGYGYQWQFGASGPVAGAQAAFTFDSSGLYSIILTVSDTCGNSASDTLQVAVQDCAEALSCPCKNGVNIVADSINGTRLSTLTALGILPPGLLANTCLAVSGLLLIDEDYDISGGE